MDKQIAPAAPWIAVVDTPFGKAAVNVNTEGEAYIEPAHGIDARGYVHRGYINVPTDSLAEWVVNGKTYTGGIRIIKANEAQAARGAEWVIDYHHDFTPAALNKVAAEFLDKRAEYITPDLIHAAKVNHLHHLEDKVAEAAKALQAAQAEFAAYETEVNDFAFANGL